MMDEALGRAVEVGRLRPLDLHFARWMVRLAGLEEVPELLLAAALASHRVGEGDVCAGLGDYAGQAPFGTEGPGPHALAPALAPWRERLLATPVVGGPGEETPLILDRHGRLYLGRYWHFEQTLARSLAERAGGWADGVDRELLRAGIARLFPAGPQTDWQRVAAAVALLRRLCVITGGPGTGKTRTVTAILALLAEQTGARPPRMAMAAPTGKAAARLGESVARAKSGLGLQPALAARLPDEALTLHRLLGFRPGRSTPAHHADNPLHLDLLVVDEASMVDLAMMSRLVAALPPHARLILLGDRDQLASVEAGMVLGDICGGQREPAYSSELAATVEQVSGDRLPRHGGGLPPLADSIVKLRTSYRFGADSGIGALARAVNAGEPGRTLELLRDGGRSDLSWTTGGEAALTGRLRQRAVVGYRDYLRAADPASALAAFNGFRVLCAVRNGPFGVTGLNRAIEQALREAGLIEPGGEFYRGRPVLVTGNDYAQGLFNGDVGLLLPDPAAGGVLRAFFQAPQGLRRVLPARLPSHETAFAMTVHKSQGSEFARVLLVLPGADSRSLKRELLYTGITRAREAVEILAGAAAVERTVESSISRTSGLFEGLWGEGGR